MTHRILVCGTYKSGTSLITGLLNAWGAYIGQEDDLYQGDNGCLEHLVLQKINDDLLNNNSRIPTPASVLAEKTNDPDFSNQAKQSLINMDHEAQKNGALAWAWKDPRLPLTLPFWEPIWGNNVIYVIPVRQPVETIISAAKMDGLSPEEVPLSAGLAYWQFCMLNILTFTQHNPHKIFIAYDQLILHPQQECERLGHFLDEHCNVPVEKINRGIEGMVALVNPGRHHQHHHESLADLEITTTEQRALYDFLRIKTIYPDESFRKEDFACYPGWMEYLQAMDTLTSFYNNSREM